jgi:hypothetical protein
LGLGLGFFELTRSFMGLLRMRLEDDPSGGIGLVVFALAHELDAWLVAERLSEVTFEVLAHALSHF